MDNLFISIVEIDNLIDIDIKSYTIRDNSHLKAHYRRVFFEIKKEIIRYDNNGKKIYIPSCRFTLV